MPVDVFDREVKASIDEIKAALLGDVGNKKTAQKKDENTAELKKLNDNLEKIIGNDLDRELKALNKLIKRVAECCEEAISKKGQQIDKQAKAYAKAVAKALKPGNGGDISKVIKDTFSEIKPAFEKITDKTMTFGKALEKSQRRFSAAFGMIGKDFTKTFGNLGKLNPFKWFQKEGEKAAKESQNMFRSGWNTTMTFFKDGWQRMTTAFSEKANALWEGVTSKASALWEGVTSKASALWEGVTNKVSGWWEKLTKKVSDSWVGKVFGFVGRSVDALGKAVGGTVRNFLQLGKTTEKPQKKAQSDIDDLTGKGRVTHGEGTPVDKGRKAKVGGGTSDLCRCICRCINKLLGVTKDGVKHTKQTARSTLSQARKNRGGQKAQMAVEKEGVEETKKNGKDSQKAMMREWMQDKRREKWERIGATARGRALQGTSAASRFVFSEKPMEALLNGVATGIAKTAGKVVEAPFTLLGDVTDKLGGLIPYVGSLFSALGPVIKAFGAALGGLAEGMINFVLTPLIEQVEAFSNASQAMFVSTGATTMAPTVNMSGFGAPPKGTGDEWTTIAKRVTEYNSNLDAASRTLEKLGTTMDDIGETGQSFTTIQKRQLTNFKKGVQETKTLNKLTRVGLQTATLINADGEQTSEMFLDWHQRLGMTTNDLRSMQRGMTQIARSTGLVGNELLNVAKSAHSFMEDMRKAGTLTTTAARSLIETMARAKKTGTEAEAQSMTKIMSGGRLRGNLSPQEMNLAAVGGKGMEDAITFGVVQGNKELEAKFAKNLEGWLTSQTAQALQAEGKTLDPNKSLAENMKKLSATAISRMSYLTKELFGMGAEAMRIEIDNIKDRSKTFAQRIEDLNKSTSTQAMTIDELAAIADKEKAVGKDGLTWRQKFDKAIKEAGPDTSKALDELLNMGDLPREMRKQLQGQLSAQQASYQKQQLFLTTGADFLQQFSNSVEDGAKDFDGAIENIAKGSKDYQEYLKAIGADPGKGTEAVEKALLDQAKRMRDEAIKIGAPEIAQTVPTAEEIKKAIAEKDVKTIKSLATELADLQGRIQRQAQKKADPISEMRDALLRLEARFKGFLLDKLAQAMPFLTEAIRQLTTAPFWDAFAKGDIKKGFELLGDFVGNMADNIMKAMGQIEGLPTHTGFQRFLAAIINGIATIAKPLLDGIGEYIKKNAPELAKMFDGFNFDEFIKGIKDVAIQIRDIIGVISNVIMFLWEWKEVILVVIGLLAVGGLIAAFAGVSGALAGAAGLIALLAGLGVAIYALHNNIRGIEKSIQDQGTAIEKRGGEISKEGIERTTKLASGELTKEQIKIEKENAEKRLVAAQNVGKLMESGTGFGMVEDLTFGFYGAGTREQEMKAKIAIKKQEMEAKEAIIMAKHADAIADATSKEEKSRLQEIAYREAYAENMAVANIKLAKTYEQARLEAKKGAEGLQAELAEIHGRHTQRVNAGVNITKFFHGTTKEEDEALALLPKLEKQQEALREKEAQILGVMRETLQRKDEKGNIQWLNIQEAGKRWQAATKDVDKAAAAEFAKTESLGEMFKKMDQSTRDAWKIYATLPDTEEGLKKSQQMAEEQAKRLNAYEAARGKIVEGMLKDEQGRVAPFEKVLDKFNESFTRTKKGVYSLAPDKDALKAFKEQKTLEDMDTLNKGLMNKFKEQFHGARTEKEKTAILERASGVKDAMYLAKTEFLKPLLMNQGKYVAADVAAGNLKQMLRPEDIGEDITGKLSGAKNITELKQMSEKEQTALKAQYDEANSLTTKGDIAQQLAKMQLATELLEKKMQTTAAAAAPAPGTPADLQLTVLNEIKDILQKTYDIQVTAATASNALTEEATKKGTLYVEDTALKNMITEKMFGMSSQQLAETIAPLVDKQIIANPTMPAGMSQDVEAELRRNKAEAQNGDVDMAKTENNTGTTAAGVMATVKVLNKIGRLLAKKGNNNLGDEGPDYPLEAFMEDVLPVGWANATKERQVGLEFEVGDFTGN
jgi:hypothetical protein